MPANQRSGQLNTSRLLREIWLNRGCSRIELAHKLELDKSTVTLLVNKMLKCNVLETLSEGNPGPRGGRKPQALGIRADFGYFLGLEVQPKGIRIVLIDLLGNLIEKSKRFISLEKASLEKDLLPEILKIYNEMKSRYSILGIGLALSGIIDHYQGRILQSMVLDIYEPVPLLDLTKDLFPCPVIVENDANCCAWGELVQNRERNLSDFLFILLESDYLYDTLNVENRFSMGLGISFDGKIYHGKQFSSGEFRSMLWTAGTGSQFAMDIHDLAKLRTDTGLRNQLFHEISRNIAFLTNTLNLNHLYIGGDIEPYWEEFRTTLEEEIQRNWSYPDRVSCECHLSSKGEYAAAYGAAAMHLERIFASHQASFYQERSQKIGLEALNAEI